MMKTLLKPLKEDFLAGSAQLVPEQETIDPESLLGERQGVTDRGHLDQMNGAESTKDMRLKRLLKESRFLAPAGARISARTPRILSCCRSLGPAPST